MRLAPFLLIIFCFSCQLNHTAEKKKQSSSFIQIPYSVRGLSCLDSICLLGGNQGFVGVWDLQENTIEWEQPDSENDSVQFRATAITKQGTYYAIPAGSPMTIWKKKVGENWEPIFSESNPNVFVDGLIAVENTVYGYGDPIGDSLYFFSIVENQVEFLPSVAMQKGEAGFAASNSGIQYAEGSIYIATGGAQSRILQYQIASKSWKDYATRLQIGEGKGVFGFDIEDSKLYAVGGSYQNASKTDSTVDQFFVDGEQFIQVKPDQLPELPYCSDVEILGEGLAIATGRSGVFELKGAMQLKIDTIPFYAIEETAGYIVFSGNKVVKRIVK